MNYEGKNGRPRFGNPETCSFWCWMVDYNEIMFTKYERQYRNRFLIGMILGQPVFCRHLLLHPNIHDKQCWFKNNNHKTVKFHFSSCNPPNYELKFWTVALTLLCLFKRLFTITWFRQFFMLQNYFHQNGLKSFLNLSIKYQALGLVRWWNIAWT